MMLQGHREVEFIEIPVTTYVRLAHARWLPPHLRPAGAAFALDGDKVLYPVPPGASYLLSTIATDPDMAINKTLDSHSRAISAA